MDVNFSSGEEQGNETYRYFYAPETFWRNVVYSCVCVSGFVTNMALVAALIKDPLKCFRDTTSYLVMSLAVSDLCNLAMMASWILYRSVDSDRSATQARSVSEFFFVAGCTAMASTFHSVCGLAFERCLQIVRPLWHRVNVTTRACLAAIAASWFCTVFVSCVPKMAALLFGEKSGRTISPPVVILTLYCAILLLVTLATYVVSVVSVREQQRRLANMTSAAARRSAESRLKNHRRFLITIFIITVIVAVSLIPTLVFFLPFYGIVDNQLSDFGPEIFHVIDLAFIVNISVNPFVYVWRLPKYRKTFLRLYCCSRK